MRSRLPFAAFAFTSTMFAAASAFAQQPAQPSTPADPSATPTTTTPATSTSTSTSTSTTTTQTDKPKKDEDEEDDFKQVTLTANPLSLILLRIGINVEYLPARHHAITLNPYFSSASVELGQSKTSYTTFGAELGYRFYTGNRGANGFFVGPAVFIQNTSQSTTVSGGTPATTASGDSSTLVYGGILDIGGQHVFKGGFTIGGGAGVMYLRAANEPTATSSTVKFSGVLPRFLFTVGYSF